MSHINEVYIASLDLWIPLPSFREVLKRKTQAKDEVERMVKDAESNAKADKEKSEQIEIKNRAEELCYQTKSLLEKLESTITSEEKQQIEDQISELEQGIQNEDYTSIEDSINNLEKTVTNYANLVNGEKRTNGNNPSDIVIDAEVISEE